MQRDNTVHTPFAILALEGSDKHDFGVVRQIDDHSLTWAPNTEMGEIVGDWSRPPFHNNLIVFLHRPPDALIDTHIRLVKEIADRRMAEDDNLREARISRTSRTSRTSRQIPTPQPETSPKVFDDLRARMRR